MHPAKTTTSQLPDQRPAHGRSFFSLLLASLFSVSCCAQIPSIDENSQEMQVKYLAGDNDAMLFNFKYDNDSGNDFKLMVLNETGEVLFQNNYSGKKFKKKIKLTRLTDTEGVTFLIRSSRRDIQLSRKVKVPSKVVDEASLATTN